MPTLAGHPLPDGTADRLVVVERLPGSATTDFGAPGAVAAADGVPLDAATANRQADLLAAAWATLDRVAATAPAVLRKGPRGGGRDRDAVVAHVREAELAHARKVGLRLRPARPGPALRAAVLDVVRDPGRVVPDQRGWPLRYAVRRFAWHMLDHAWEIEDRSVP